MTAYELRISDWSSDVCSSDLLYPDRRVRRRRAGGAGPARVFRIVRSGVAPRRRPGRAVRDRRLAPAALYRCRDRGRPGLYDHDDSAVNRRELIGTALGAAGVALAGNRAVAAPAGEAEDPKSQRLNSSHLCGTRMPSTAG